MDRMKKENKNKWLHLRLSETEYNQLQTAFKKTTERKISVYSRKILLGKAMIKGTRNLSVESLITEFSKLQKDLNGIGNNFNQAVHKLHTLQHPEQFQKWLTIYELDRRKLLKDIETMKDFMNQTASTWLQE
ncbi:hypothetical protein SAMN04488055_1254 [Chitinophaga niabensis]|uniref:Mobilisation protein (MobC) n=2 Tax=Chitinophaga niabensis TaxID=536979 RepID=A0A1N6E2E0_9BACT|nr:hypothetical protein SAMN04488055_1254 [Chitinophaga niabensis]